MFSTSVRNWLVCVGHTEAGECGGLPPASINPQPRAILNCSPLPAVSVIKRDAIPHTLHMSL